MIQWRDGMPYQHNLEAVRRVIDAQSSSAWNENIYTGWLDTLRTLSSPTTDSRYPEAMRTRAWAMKTLNTQLASWTELRHDTILYAKQSYTPPGACSYPDGYVEPRTEFFARLEQLSLRAAQLIGALDLNGVFAQIEVRSNFERGDQELELMDVSLAKVKEKQVIFLEYFAGMIAKLRTLAEKEVRHERMNAEDIRFLDRLIQSTRTNGAGGPRRYDGWYTRMYYQNIMVSDADFYLKDGAQRWDALVADVHTDLPCGFCSDPGGVLHQATGNAHLLVLAVDHGDQKMIYAGPVFSHYEFELVGPPKRLSDTDWKAQWNEAGFSERTPTNPDEIQTHKWNNLPPHPEWTRSFLVPEPTRH